MLEKFIYLRQRVRVEHPEIFHCNRKHMQSVDQPIVTVLNRVGFTGASLLRYESRALALAGEQHIDRVPGHRVEDILELLRLQEAYIGVEYKFANDRYFELRGALEEPASIEAEQDHLRLAHSNDKVTQA